MKWSKPEKKPVVKDKKLALKKERLRDLTQKELTLVAGGGPISKLSTALE